MRCIEMQQCRDSYVSQRMINRNMRCIEMDNDRRHGKKYGGLIET